MSRVFFILGWILVCCRSFSFAADIYLEQALAFPDLPSLAFTCRHNNAVRGIRIVDASSWGSGATDFIVTKSNFLLIHREFSFDEKTRIYRSHSKTITLPAPQKELQALFTAFANASKEKLLKAVPKEGNPVIDGGSAQIAFFDNEGPGYEIILSSDQSRAISERKIEPLFNLEKRFSDLKQHHLPSYLE